MCCARCWPWGRRPITGRQSVDNAAEEAAKALEDVEIMSEEEMDALVTAQLGKLDQ